MFRIFTTICLIILPIVSTPILFAQTLTDSLTSAINQEKDLSKKNELYLKRALSFPLDQSSKAVADIENAKKYYQKQNLPQGIIDADLTLSDHYFLTQKYLEASKWDSVGLKNAEKIKYDKGLARAQGNLARDLIGLGNYQMAEKHLDKAIALENKFRNKDYNVIAELYNRKSIISSENGKIAESLRWIEQAIEMAHRTNDKKLLMRLYLNNSISYNRISKYQQSVENNLQVIKLAEEIGDNENLLKAYNNIAITFRHLKEFDKAKLYHHKAIDLSEKVKNYKSLGLSLMNLATVYVLSEQMENLDTLYLKSIESFKKINDQNSLAMAYHNYGNYFSKIDQPEKAEQNLKQALEIRRKNASPPAIASTLAVLAKQMTKKNNFRQAEIYLAEAEKIMEGRKENKIFNEIYAYSKELYAAQKNYQKAFEYQGKELAIVEEIYNENERVNALKAETDYEIEKQKLENQITKNQQEKRQLYIASVSVFVILILVAVILVFWQRRIQLRKLHDLELVQLEQKHKIELSNSLVKTEQNERKKIAEKLHDETVGILSIAKLNVEQLSAELFTSESEAGKKIETAKNLLHQASESIRNISHTLMPVTLEKYGLKIAIEDLISAVNTSESIKVEYVIEGLDDSKNWDSQFNITIYRMVQEVFNNIFKHAQATHVFLQIMELENVVTIFIEDNGKGFQPAEKGDAGIGIQLLEQNIKYFNGKIEINGQESQGTFVLAELPILIKS